MGSSRISIKSLSNSEIVYYNRRKFCSFETKLSTQLPTNYTKIITGKELFNLN